MTSVKLVRNYETRNSLGYAFIDFEDKKACEQAYRKMNNTLIDDRRIHVDFSQSVAKLWSIYRITGQMDTGKGYGTAAESPKRNKRRRDFGDGKYYEDPNPKHRELDDDGVRKIQKRDGYERHRQEERSKHHKTGHCGSGASASRENERYHRGLKDFTYRRNTDHHNLKARGGRPEHNRNMRIM